MTPQEEWFSEQRQADQVLQRSGVGFRDDGHGFHVYGRYDRYLTPAEVLRLNREGRLK